MKALSETRKCVSKNGFDFLISAHRVKFYIFVFTPKIDTSRRRLVVFRDFETSTGPLRTHGDQSFDAYAEFGCDSGFFLVKILKVHSAEESLTDETSPSVKNVSYMSYTWVYANVISNNRRYVSSKLERTLFRV